MPRCFVAFGGNLGPVAETFRDAAIELRRTPGVALADRSRLYRTAPIGSSAGPAYLNSVAAIETSLAPEELLSVLKRVEERFGRTRTGHWSPRTLDLDLVAFADVVQSTPRLSIPHPHCWYRRFVLDPWNDVAPTYVHPVLGESVAQLRERLLSRPLIVAVDVELNAVRDRLRSNRDVEIVDASAESAAITFASGPISNGARCMNVSSASDPAALIEQVLRAALDEPSPVSDNDWIFDETPLRQ